MDNHKLIAVLKSTFKYDQKTGELSRKSGKKVSSITNGNGYYRTWFNGKSYLVHRLIWAYVHGDFPNGDIDHINGVKTDNRISNLRIVDKSGNGKNAKKRVDNSIGIVGVGIYKRRSIYRAYISSNKQRYALGYFRCFFEACCARKSAENFFSFHPNHGKR